MRGRRSRRRRPSRDACRPGRPLPRWRGLGPRCVVGHAADAQAAGAPMHQRMLLALRMKHAAGGRCRPSQHRPPARPAGAARCQQPASSRGCAGSRGGIEPRLRWIPFLRWRGDCRGEVRLQSGSPSPHTGRGPALAVGAGCKWEQAGQAGATSSGGAAGLAGAAGRAERRDRAYEAGQI